MVVLNLTLLVELGLFLIFLWVTSRFILRPMLNVMDGREEKLKQDSETARTDNSTAQTLEEEYSGTVAGIQRAIHERVERERRTAQECQLAELAKHRRTADEAVAEARKTAWTQAAAQEADYERCTSEIADAVMEKLGCGGGTP